MAALEFEKCDLCLRIMYLGIMNVYVVVLSSVVEDEVFG